MNLRNLFVLLFLVNQSLAENKCGVDFLSSACGTPCPSGLDSECEGPGEICIANAPDCDATVSPTFSGQLPNRCGFGFEDSGCGEFCPNGLDSECPTGQICIANPPICNQPTSAPTPNLGFGACNIQQFDGGCKDLEDCPGIRLNGFCTEFEGECCVLEPKRNAVFHTPATPDFSQSTGSCVTIQDEFEGDCIAEAACTGATYNDVQVDCAANTKCCVIDDGSVPNLIADPFLSGETEDLFLLSFQQFRNLFEGISATRATALFPFYNFALAQILLDSENEVENCFRSAAFSAQIGFESSGLLFFESTTTGEENEGLASIGNTQPGDGTKFKGRGPIQLTGRSNYATAAERLGLPELFETPEVACLPSVGFATAADFWLSNNLNRFAGSNSNSAFESLTRQINGGLDGLNERKTRWFNARDLLGCDNLVVDNEEPNENDSLPIIIGAAGGALALIAGVLVFVALKKYREEHEFDRKSLGEILDNQHKYY